MEGKDFDIVVIGGSAVGSYFAMKAARQGFRTAVIEKSSADTVGGNYDIVHIEEKEFSNYELPEVREGDGIFAFRFDRDCIESPTGRYPKPNRGGAAVIGLHKQKFIAAMNEKAKDAGARFLYGCVFKSFTFDGSGRINGVIYTGENGEENKLSCRLAADCSGIPAAGRKALPDGYGVEKFTLKSEDLFFVTLYYVTFTDGRSHMYSESWPYYKTWLAPSGKEDGAILGIGSFYSYEYGENVMETFKKNVELPPYTVDKVERGLSVHHRALYSFVGDGFICMGDSACLSKPFNGEGIPSSLFQVEIAADVIGEAMKDGKYPTKADLWAINKRYNNSQGREFAVILAGTERLLRISGEAMEYLFRKDVVFSKRIMAATCDIGGPIYVFGDAARWIKALGNGLAKGFLKASELHEIFGKTIRCAIGNLALYSLYPKTPGGFEKWTAAADAMWKRIGKMSDVKADYKVMTADGE